MASSLAAGPLAGTNAQCFAPWIAMTKRPLTGGYARSVGGADFGAWIKFAGFDFILVEGKADKPVYVHMGSDGCSIHDAAQLWGKDTQETQSELCAFHGEATRAACIGLAGENLVRFASIVSGRRTAARCGVGAVMGSKNLKAIAITPRQHRVEIYDPEPFKHLVMTQVQTLKKNPVRQGLSEYGTSLMTERANAMGFFPVRNHRWGQMTACEGLSAKAFSQTKRKGVGCYSCMIRCGQVREVGRGLIKGGVVKGQSTRPSGPLEETLCLLQSIDPRVGY